MTDLQRIALRQSEIRTRLHDLGVVEDQNDETRSEIGKLTTEMKDLETRSQALIVAGEQPEEEPEDEQRDEQLQDLIQRAGMDEIFTAALEHRSTDGATRELQDEFDLGSNQIPIAMFRGLETRAVTPAPSDVSVNQAEIVPGVFPQSAAVFMGVDMPTVGVGEAVFPVLTQNAVVGTPDENAIPSGTGLDAEGSTTGSFSADVLSPSRLQASFFYSREDRARFAGMDESLRMNLSDALSDALDQQILAGTDGLFAGTNLANHNVSAVTSYALYRDHLAYGRVDGIYAVGTSDLRILMGSGTYAHAAKQFRSDNAGDRAAIEDLMAATAGVRVSAHVPAVASVKQNVVIRLGMRRDMVAPVWDGVTLIPDEITKAATGQIKVTAVMLYAIKVLRAGGFYKQQTQHA